MEYFNQLGGEEKLLYEPPEKYDLPADTVKPSFWYQFISQLQRALIVAWRDRLSKIISSTIIVGSVVFITALDGVTQVSVDDRDPNLPFMTMVRPQPSEFPNIFQELFEYSESAQGQ